MGQWYIFRPRESHKALAGPGQSGANDQEDAEAARCDTECNTDNRKPFLWGERLMQPLIKPRKLKCLMRFKALVGALQCVSLHALFRSRYLIKQAAKAFSLIIFPIIFPKCSAFAQFGFSLQVFYVVPKLYFQLTVKIN